MILMLCISRFKSSSSTLGQQRPKINDFLESSTSSSPPSSSWPQLRLGWWWRRLPLALFLLLVSLAEFEAKTLQVVTDDEEEDEDEDAKGHPGTGGKYRVWVCSLIAIGLAKEC